MHQHMMCIKVVVTLLALSVLACSSCSGCDKEEKAPSTWSVDRTAKPTPPKATSEVVKGSALNGVFLAEGHAGLKRVFTTEKAGFAQADYKKGQESVFTLSVTDLKEQPDLRAKYTKSTETIFGHSYLARGKKGSMLLVNGRFQVKLTSKSFDETTRKKHLSELNFSALPQ